MSETNVSPEQWAFLIGYPLQEAEDILREENVSYRLQFTAAPGKASSPEDAYVIAVRPEEPLVLVCASPDWNVK